MRTTTVLRLDTEELDWRSAFTGLVGLLLAVTLIGVLGNVGVAAGIAVLFVVGADDKTHKGPDLAQLVLVVGGALVTYIVGVSSSSTAAAAVVIGLVTLACTLLLLLGSRGALVGGYALVWTVLALTIGVTDESAAEMAVAFAAGGAIALVVLFVSAWAGNDDRETQPTGGDDTAESDGAHAALPRQMVVTFAVVRALAASLAVVIGYEWFPAHPAWVVLTFVLVLKPPKETATTVAVGRTIGTVAGVLIGMAAAHLVGDNLAGQIVAFLLAGFFMLATRDVSYAVSTGFTTAMLLLSVRILHDDVYEAGWDRLGATVVGVAIAFVLIGVMAAVRGLGQPTLQQEAP